MATFLSRSPVAVVGDNASRLSILILGNEKWKWNAEHDWADGFQRLGHDAVVMDERTPSQKILREARNKDLVLMISSNKSSDKAIMKKLNAITLTASWHADLFWGLSRPNWKRNAMWSAQYCFTADGGHQTEWEQMGVNHSWLLPGVRDEWAEKSGAFDPMFACDVAFVGSNGSRYHEQWKYRSTLVNQLIKICKRNHWVFRNPGGYDSQIERDASMSNFYRSAKVTVGDSLCLNRNRALYWSDRVYEATGRSGLLVMPQIDALQDQFPAMPTYEWGDWKGLETILGNLLESENERAEVRRICHKATASCHTYSKRAQTLLAAVGLE